MSSSAHMATLWMKRLEPQQEGGPGSHEGMSEGHRGCLLKVERGLTSSAAKTATGIPEEEEEEEECYEGGYFRSGCTLGCQQVW